MAAKVGDTVRVHYTGTLNDGTEFDTSIGNDPLEFVIGEGSLIGKFEEAVVGSEPGESKIVHVKPEEAYGLKRDELIINISKDKLPPELIPEVGLSLQMQTGGDGIIVLRIIEVNEDSVTVDANHELAGEELTFNIQFVGFASKIIL